MILVFTSISKNNLTPQHPRDVFRAPFCNLAMFCTIDPNRFISDNNNTLALTLELVKKLFLLGIQLCFNMVLHNFSQNGKKQEKISIFFRTRGYSTKTLVTCWEPWNCIWFTTFSIWPPIGPNKSDMKKVPKNSSD